ncbi:hypothetical protein BH18THE2_BH18THE2_06390 [soil metagenome]
MELVLVIIVLSLLIYYGLANAKNILEVQGANSIKLIVEDDNRKSSYFSKKYGCERGHYCIPATRI